MITLAGLLIGSAALAWPSSPLAAGPGAAEAQAPPADCALERGPVRTVSRIIDADTIVLDDGSEVRLIGALAPRASDAAAKPGTWPLETEAAKALGDLVMGQRVRLGFGKTRTDRYGRLLAHVFTGSNGTSAWVQGAMLARGLARAYAVPSAADCLNELIAHERAARDAGAGVWGATTYRPIDAARTALLMSKRSSFQIVRGTVTAVGRTKGAVYLNFGDNWRSDFSIRIPRAVASAHGEWNNSLDALKGRAIEVRGWIVRNNGPMIEVSSPAEITEADGSALASYSPGGANPATIGGNRDTDHALPRPAAPDDAADGEKQNRPKPKAPGGLDL